MARMGRQPRHPCPTCDRPITVSRMTGKVRPHHTERGGPPCPGSRTPIDLYREDQP